MSIFDEFDITNVGKGYANYQFAKAFNRVINAEESTEKSYALQKLEKWQSVIHSMNKGIINIGSRRPANAPEWVTLEVVTGGFATGKYLAGGEIQDFETNLIKKFDLEASRENVRKTLNSYFLTEDGLNQLYKLYSNYLFISSCHYSKQTVTRV